MRAGRGQRFRRANSSRCRCRHSLPVWLTCIHEESFVRAGELGRGRARLPDEPDGGRGGREDRQVPRGAGRDTGMTRRRGTSPSSSTLSSATTLDAAREQARGPLREYLRSYPRQQPEAARKPERPGRRRGRGHRISAGEIVQRLRAGQGAHRHAGILRRRGGPPARDRRGRDRLLHRFRRRCRTRCSTSLPRVGHVCANVTRRRRSAPTRQRAHAAADGIAERPVGARADRRATPCAPTTNPPRSNCAARSTSRRCARALQARRGSPRGAAHDDPTRRRGAGRSMPAMPSNCRCSICRRRA